jgi:hypothetical protein
MQNRTVAIFDILGFRELVRTTPLDKLAERFQRTIDQGLPKLIKAVAQPLGVSRLIPDSETAASWCLLYSFSDTIILISDDETREACLKVLLYSFRVLQFLTFSKLYARGGVAFGEMFVDLDRRLFLGKALVEAFEMQSAQDWIGGAISDGLEHAFPRLFSDPPILDSVFPLYEVPMKEGPVKKLRTINWRWNVVAEAGTRSLFDPTTEWPERRKVENTLAYLKFVRSTGRAYPAGDDCPAELHRAFVGKGPPPPHAWPTYPHGDDL